MVYIHYRNHLSKYVLDMLDHKKALFQLLNFFFFFPFGYILYWEVYIESVTYLIRRRYLRSKANLGYPYI